MAPFDNLAIVNEVSHLVEVHFAFSNYFQKQAKRFSNNVYVRYQTLSPDGDVVVKTLTYGQVDRITSNLACNFHTYLSGKSVVSLIEDHSVNYLMVNLAVYKLRIPILLLSPRNSFEAVRGLLKQAEAEALIYGASYNHVKDNVLEENPGLDCFPVPELDLEEMAKAPLNPDVQNILDFNFSNEDLKKTVTIVHSSGTTGLPKAVRWSNQFYLYLFQAYQHNLLKRQQFKYCEDENDVLIGITPSFHLFGQFSNSYCTVNGGSTFYFRQFPPSTNEVISVMKTENVTRLNAPPYFINQMLHYMQETGDVETFQKLKLIISGGAATPKITDEFFMKHKLNFVSVYAMSECNNLMSSDITENRIDSNTYFFIGESEKYSYLEHFDRERYQLIIKECSPFLATGVSNRENGDYATKDLFIKSKLVENGFNYVGRADDTLVMINGEKTNPLPMEDVIKSSPMVSHCTVIGEAQPCSAALIELNYEVVKNHCLDVVLEKVHQVVQKANKDAPNHSAILPEMVKIIPFARHLPVTDKGTVSRKRAIGLFQEDVDDMYTNFLSSVSHKKIKTSNSSNEPNDIETEVSESVSRVLKAKKPLQKDVSLFKQGLNSLLAIQLRNHISEKIRDVPQDFLYEHPTISSIINFFTDSKLYNGSSLSSKEFNYQDTTDILNKYLDCASEDLVKAQITDYFSPNGDKEHIVLLTGATGSLGSSILLNLLCNPKIKKVYCLVRGNSSTDLMGRIAESFRKRSYSEFELYKSNRVEALPTNFEKKNFGLSDSLYKKLKSEVTMIQACAWLLDFNQPVSHYDSECLGGLYNLVKFANKETNPIHIHFISSVSASGAYGNVIPEVPMPSDPQVALPMGYGQSKFIVEQLFHYLVEEKNMPCYIYRVGQLCGDSTNGSWNTSEMYPLTFIGGGCHMKKMPDFNRSLDWLPVNFAGKAIVDIMMGTSYSSPSSAKDTIFHIVNPNEVSWSSVLESMKSYGMKFDIIDPESWVKELALHQDNPAHVLYSFYEKLFKNNTNDSARWETDNTSTLAPTIRNAPTVKDELFRYLDYWKEVGFYSN